MDNKGRIMLPAPLKKQLLPVIEDGFVVKRSVFQQCLELYPLKEWNQVMTKVNSLNRFVKKNNDFIRMFTAGVKMIDLDSAGRINVSKDLINFASISSSIVMSSAGNIIEIWDKDLYEKTLNDPEIDFSALAEEVMGNENAAGNELP